MIIENRQLYSLDDVAIMPAAISRVNHRSECDVRYTNGYLPIFTAPMPCVVDSETYSKFETNGIRAILPRTESLTYRLSRCRYNWCAFSLDEFEENFINDDVPGLYVLIDIANGNMNRLYQLAAAAKKKYTWRMKLMVGNIANPQTFRDLAEIGVDYVRCSVGSGTACTTSTNLGIHYPMASLIDECHKLKQSMLYTTGIVADGGLTTYRDMIKALALGADYIMLGSALNKLEDSAGEIVTKTKLTWNGTETKTYKKYYGMASRVGMKKLGKHGTPEGKTVLNECNGTIESFVMEFTDYLRSAMSYCDALNLEEFIGGPEINILSHNASMQFNQTN